MADIASPIKTLGAFPAIDPTVAAIGTADQIADGETNVSMTKGERQIVTGAPLQSDPIYCFQATGEGINGAAVRTSGNPPVTTGVTIPAGSTGQASYTLWRLGLADYPVGTQLRLTTYLTTSDNLLSTLNFAPGIEIRGSQGNAQQVAGSTSAVQISTNILRLRGDYIVQGSARELMGLLMQLGSTAPGGASAERWFEHLESYIEIVSTAARQSSNSLSLRSSRPLRTALLYTTYLTIAGDGSGDVTTIGSGVAASAGRSPVAQGRIDIAAGDYIAVNAIVPRNTIMSRKTMIRPHLKAWNAASASLGTIATAQAVWVNDAAELRGIHASVKNGRYAVHSDSGPSDKRATMIFDDCRFEHYGNQEAIDWQTANSGYPANVWAAVSALGMGLHSGQTVLSRRTHWISPNKPFYFHDTIDWAEDAYVLIEGGSVVCTAPGNNGYDYDFKCLGSMRHTVVDIRGVTGSQPLNLDDKTGTSTGWLNTALSAQVADRRQMTINVWGPRSLDWTYTQTNCQTLELRGPSGSAATPFTLSGAGAIALFGAAPDYRVCPSLPTRTAAYSQFALTSDVNANVSLPARLGDRTSAPLTLTVQGPVSGVIYLDENYGAMANNAAVITALNAKLTAAGLSTISFNLATPYEERGRVYHPDLEVIVKNTDTATMARGNAVAIGAKRGEAKLTVSATTANGLLGIALEDIPVGGTGRVLRINKGGLISQSHLVLAGMGAPAVGDILYITATTGALGPVAGTGNVPVLKCVETGRTSKPFTRWEFV